MRAKLSDHLLFLGEKESLDRGGDVFQKNKVRGPSVEVGKKRGGGFDSCQKYSEDPWDTEVNNEINLSCKTRCEITLGPKIKCLDFYAVNESVEIC